MVPSGYGLEVFGRSSSEVARLFSMVGETELVSFDRSMNYGAIIK